MTLLEVSLIFVFKYFVWYLCLVPLVMPRLRISWLKAGALFSGWMFCQVLWLYFAFQLEFVGLNSYFEVCLAGLLFLIYNCAMLKYAVIDCYECSFVRARNEANKQKLN